MVYQADTLRDTLFSNWALTGALSKLGSQSVGDTPVMHLAHSQIKGVQANKSVEVRKLSPQENGVFHPKFVEITDVFEIVCRYSMAGTNNDVWDSAESNIEDMEEEVTRILKTVYDPFTGTGVYFKTNWVWSNRDKLESQPTPILQRVLTLSLIDIRPRNNKVFTGFTGLLKLDISESEGSGLPGSDYTYTEVFNVQSTQGFRLKQVQVTSNPNGRGYPVNFSGGFGGTWIASTFLKAEDIGSGAHQINTIWKRIVEDEQPEMTFIRMYTAEDGVTTLSVSTKIIITGHSSIEPDHDLLKMDLVGVPIEPSVFTVA